MVMDMIKTVYVRLLNEGTNVSRPTQAILHSDGNFHLLLPSDYDSEDETWEFLPGSVVACQAHIISGEEVLLAVKEAKI